MCYDATFNGHKTLVCTVGDLKPSQQYRTPDGNTLMILQDDQPLPGGVKVVDLATGEIDIEGSDVKLGTDRRGRLYASRSLNATSPSAGFADAPANAIEADQAQAIFSDAEHKVDLNDAFEPRHPSDYIDPTDDE